MVATGRAVGCLALWLLATQVRASSIPLKMNRTIQNLLQHYRITPRERFNGKPVFSRDPLAGKMEAKMVFMDGVLETYEKLIGHMLKQLPTPTPASAAIAAGGEVGVGDNIRTDLSYILKLVQNLKKHRFKEQDTFLQELRALKDIQMDNLVVQSKALWELPWLYEEAHSMYDIKMERRRRRRRRRQAQRLNTRPRA